jgi:hypothetical protein
VQPSAPREVTIQFTVNPPTARPQIVVDGRRLEEPRATVPASRDRPLAVRVSAPGYEPFEAHPLPVSDRVIPIDLIKIAKPRQRPRVEPHVPAPAPAPEKKSDPRVKRIEDL